MNSIKRMKPTAAALALLLLLGACSGSTEGSTEGGSTPPTPITSDLPVLVDSPYVLTGSDEGAADFLALNETYASPYLNDTCQNITPATISENSEFTVFKYLSSNDSFVLFDGAAYPIGTAFDGGDGVTSLALADLNGDGVRDLCYASSKDSSFSVGYFDPAAKTATELPGRINGQPAVLGTDGEKLLLYAAKVSNYESLTSMTLEPGEPLAAVVDRDGTPALDASLYSKAGEGENT